jgi:hypothetical protein
MKKLLPLLVVLGLLVATVALAAPAPVAAQGLRVHVGWVDPQDFSSTIVIGGDYIWDHALATVNYFNVDSTGVWTFEGDYLYRAPEDQSLYAGAGLGLGFANSSNNLLFNVLVGKEFQMKNTTGAPYLEARYDFGNDLDGESINGLRIVAGWRF